MPGGKREESGLVGSTAYVNGLSQAERDRVALYLNFDMIGSPNYIFMVYDSDQSGFTAPVPVPAGSIAIEDLFESDYTLAGEPYDDAQFSGRSDYQAFILNGIPAGGLFTGAEVPKTAAQAAIWGGVAGAQYDPCYHLACDTFANNNLHALEVNSDAIAFAILTYAYSTETVNGVVGDGCRATSPSLHRPGPRAQSEAPPEAHTTPSEPRSLSEMQRGGRTGRPLPIDPEAWNWAHAGCDTCLGSELTFLPCGACGDQTDALAVSGKQPGSSPFDRTTSAPRRQLA